MRCEKCDYLRYDRADDMYECFFCIEYSENKKGLLGCKYNRKTLKKREEKYWKEEKEWAEKLYKWVKGDK
jgi:hypothetical protein